MQQIEAMPAPTQGERRRVESVIHTATRPLSRRESLAEITHDVRNMVTALGLYCELLEQPGVLTPSFTHYGGELRLVAAASRCLVEKLVALEGPAPSQSALWRSDGSAEQWPPPLLPCPRTRTDIRLDLAASRPVANVAADLLATRNLLAALAGPSITLTVDAEGGALPSRITGEDLTRVLVNLVKNAVEAMPRGGRIQITLREEGSRGQADPGRGWLSLIIEDSGPGIPADALERIFESGYTGHVAADGEAGSRLAPHRGLGLAISRSIVEAAGGHIHARNRTPVGARLVIELPVEAGLPQTTKNAATQQV